MAEKLILSTDNVKNGLKIVHIEHPEWGQFIMNEDKNGWVITGKSGSRMLFEREFFQWRIV